MQHLNPPPGLPSNKAISLKFKALKYYILNNVLYWKDSGGVLLNFLVEGEVEKIMTDFHKVDCGRHLYWKTTANKILRASFYWPILFSDVYKTIMSCHECQIFQGKRKLFPLPLKPIEVQVTF